MFARRAKLSSPIGPLLISDIIQLRQQQDETRVFCQQKISLEIAASRVFSYHLLPAPAFHIEIDIA